ncbi:Lrp/AsnC family transcriptional regulator [Bacillus tianshenii]|nr:Lrp/AsnC family transcriptional regulator [Bacillus tianshenii]
MNLDKTDFFILQSLYKDGRKAYTEIAKELEISEGKVRFRINRMLENNVFEFIIHSSPDKIGLPVQALIGINTENGARDRVACQLAGFREIRAVGSFIGKYEILIQAYFASNEELAIFMDRKLTKINEITKTETFLQLKHYKDSFNYFDILSTDLVHQ